MLAKKRRHEEDRPDRQASADASATMQAAEARERFAEALNRVAFGGERIVMERRGKRLAALVPIEDLDLIRAVEDKIDLAAAKKALREKGRNISHAALKKELGL